MNTNDIILDKIAQLERSVDQNLLASKDVLSVHEAARFLDIRVSYLYKLTSRRKIPFYKPEGKRIFFSRKELEMWLKRNRQEMESEMK